MDLPASIASCKVLLFAATCSTGERECKAIEARELGRGEACELVVHQTNLYMCCRRSVMWARWRKISPSFRSCARRTRSWLCAIATRVGNIKFLYVHSVDTVCYVSAEVRIVTAAIDNSVDPHTEDVVPGIGNFIARYNGEERARVNV